ncbi:MAG: hypothetical protein H6621_12455, partial [Halobacteriovoraceae bacterium]|nr:hypothetical protein [Halobacteriovoraceae bacterium]
MRNNLSEISPKLLESERVVGNNNVILENNKTKSQVILPLESSDYLDYFDGQHTVKEIIAEVFEKTGKVYFDSILKTVKTLNEKKFLEDISGEIINIGKSTNPHHQKSSTLIRSFKKFILIHKKKLGVDQPNIALGLCFIVLVGALYGAYFLLPNISFENFLKSEKDYSEALVNYFIIASILLSIRGLFKILFQILACTTLYGINLRINLFSVSVDVLNNSIYALKKKIYPIFYFLTNSGTFLFSATVFSLLSPGHPLVDDTFIIATLMSFNQLDPFRKSDFTSMFQFFYEDNQLESVSPYLKNNSFAGIFKKTSGSIDEIKYASYSFLAIAWA